MPQRCSVEGVGEYIFHYHIVDGVCYMALFDKGYPKNLAFAFLEDVHKLFQEDLKREFATWRFLTRATRRIWPLLSWRTSTSFSRRTLSGSLAQARLTTGRTSRPSRSRTTLSNSTGRSQRKRPSTGTRLRARP